MAEEAVKRQERMLTDKTVRRLDKESCWGGPACGKLAEVATAVGFDKGVTKIIKSVRGSISKHELDMLLVFNEAPHGSNCVIEIWFLSLIHI